MNTTEQTALNERALQELASIQADMDNHRDPQAYERKVQYLNELVADLPKERQAHFYAEARRLKFKLDGSDRKDKDVFAGPNVTVDPNAPIDPNAPVDANQVGGSPP